MRTTVIDQEDVLQSDHTNWQGRDHRYTVRVENVAIMRFVDDGVQIVLNAHLITKDGATVTPQRRTFPCAKIRNAVKLYDQAD